MADDDVSDIDVITSSDSGQEEIAGNEDEQDLSALSDETEETETEDETSDDETIDETEDKENLTEELDEFDKEKTEVKEDETINEIRRPSLRKIMSKYPNIDKEFPDIKHVFHREQRFAEICGTVEDAREMSEKSETYDTINSKLGSGDVKFFLDVLEDNTRKEFAKNFLPTLYKADKDVFRAATKPFLVSMMHRAYESFGDDDSNVNTQNGRNSVLNICGYLFGKKELPGLDKEDIPDPKIAQEREELNREKSTHYLERYNSYRSGIQEFNETKLLAEVVGRLDSGLSDYQKSAIANAVLDDIDAELSADNLHNRTMASLWKRVEKENLDPKWRSQIISAYLGRARQSLPNIIKRYVKGGSVPKSRASEPKDRHLAITGRERQIDKKINPKSTRQISEIDLINSR